jgi:hypothetical protein
LKYDNRNCYFNGHLVVKQWAQRNHSEPFNSLSQTLRHINFRQRRNVGVEAVIPEAQ